MVDGVTKRKKPIESVDAVAQRLLAQLQPRFNKLIYAKGSTIEDGEHEGQWLIEMGSKNRKAEAKFPPGTNYQTILMSFMGWAENISKKLGAQPIGRREDEDEAA